MPLKNVFLEPYPKIGNTLAKSNLFIEHIKIITIVISIVGIRRVLAFIILLVPKFNVNNATKIKHATIAQVAASLKYIIFKSEANLRTRMADVKSKFKIILVWNGGNKNWLMTN